MDHLVFNTDDMAATIAFYADGLGLRLVHAARTPRVADEFGAGIDFRTVDSLFQTRAQARSELATLYADPVELERVLDRMPLVD